MKTSKQPVTCKVNPASFRSLAIVLAMLAVTGVAHAQYGEGISVAARASTLGVGVELKYPFHEKLKGRLVINQYDKSDDGGREGNDYEGDLELSSFGIIGDWYPTGGSFRLSAGLLSNGNELKVRTRGATYEFNDVEYTGNASVQADFKSLAPYVGLGWSSQKKNGWSFDFEVGAMLQGTAMLSGSGTATSGANTCNFSVNDDGVATVTGAAICGVRGGGGNITAAQFEDDIEAEHRELEDDIDDFKVWPVLSAGVQYRF